MLEAILLVIGGGLLLYYGGDWLVDGAAGLSLRWGLSPLVVGLTVVAFGTSAPELAVCIKAGLDNVDGIALGNVIGSNICNIGLVLALAAIVKPLDVKSQLIKIDVPLALVASFIFTFMLSDGLISRVDGAILFSIVLAYVIFSIKKSKTEGKEVDEEFEEEVQDDESKSMLQLGLLVFAGFAAVTFGGKIFVEGAEVLAKGIGVSEAVIGLTVVALGTSLPELSASLMAAKKGHGDMAIGNVVGSCIFNLLAIMGITGLVVPLEAAGINKVDLGVMLFITIILWPMLWSNKKLGRGEGFVLLGTYLVYCGYLFMNQG